MIRSYIIYLATEGMILFTSSHYIHRIFLEACLVPKHVTVIKLPEHEPARHWFSLNVVLQLR